MDFEADPIKKINFYNLTTFPISKSTGFPVITQWKYCQKLDIETDPINKFKTLITKTIFRFQNQLNFLF